MVTVRLCWIPDRHDSSFQSARDEFFCHSIICSDLGSKCSGIIPRRFPSHQPVMDIDKLAYKNKIFVLQSNFMLKAGGLKYTELLTGVIPLLNFANQSHVKVLFYVLSLKASFNFSQIL